MTEKLDILINKLCSSDQYKDLPQQQVKAIIIETGNKLTALKKVKENNAQSIKIGKPSQENIQDDAKFKKLKDFQKKNGLSIKDKRKAIAACNEHKANRSQILSKNLEAVNARLGKVKCYKEDCNSTFISELGRRMHLIKKHKVYADKIKFIYYQCELCDNRYTCFSEKALKTHQTLCYNMQREILKAKNQLLESEIEEELNSEEERQYQESLNYN